MFDTVIRGASVVDGSGRSAIETDVAIRGDQIVHVGALPTDVSTEHTVETSGCVLAPGFIDIHTHSDCSLLLNRSAESSVRQGVTTELVGNCGMGCAPVARVEDLPTVVLEYQPELNVTWRSFGEWMDALESEGVSINVAALVAHGPVRMSVIGAREKTANAVELRQMTQLVERSMEEGAFGFSSGLEYTPGKNAEQSELVALAGAAARHGGLYSTHIRNRDYHYRAAVEEAIQSAAAANISLQISHIAPRWGAPPSSNAWALERVDQANRDGADVWFDNHPYIRGRGLVMATFPSALFEGGREKLRQRLQDRSVREALREHLNPQWKFAKEGRWDLLLVFEAPNSRHYEGQTIAEIADSTGREPWDVVCDLLSAEWENPSALYWSAPIHQQADVDASFLDSRSIVMSDGSAVAPYGPYKDVKQIYAYGWASYFLRHYVRERRLLTLEEGIHKITALPAKRLGMKSRGLIAPGYKADLVLFDAGTIHDRATFEHPIGFPQGIQKVWVNGVLTVTDGTHTGARAGSVLARND